MVGPPLQRAPQMNRGLPPPGVPAQARNNVHLPPSLQHPPMMPMVPPMPFMGPGPNMGMGFHGSPISMSPRGPYQQPPPPFPGMNPFAHSPGQAGPMMNGVRPVYSHAQMDYMVAMEQQQQQMPIAPPTTQQGQRTPQLNSQPLQPPVRQGTAPPQPLPIAPLQPSQTTPVNGYLQLGSMSSPVNPGPSTSTTVHNRRPSVQIPNNAHPSAFGIISKPTGASVRGATTSILGDNDERVILPPIRRRQSPSPDRVLGSSALVDENDDIVAMPKKRGGGGIAGIATGGWDPTIGSSSSRGSSNIWSAGLGKSAGGGWPSSTSTGIGSGSGSNGTPTSAINPLWPASSGLNIGFGAPLPPVSRVNPPSAQGLPERLAKSPFPS